MLNGTPEFNRERLEKVLKAIYEHSGVTSLYGDILWLQGLQRNKPEWSIDIFDRYDKLERAKLAR